MKNKLKICLIFGIILVETITLTFVTSAIYLCESEIRMSLLFPLNLDTHYNMVKSCKNPPIPSSPERAITYEIYGNANNNDFIKYCLASELIKYRCEYYKMCVKDENTANKMIERGCNHMSFSSDGNTVTIFKGEKAGTRRDTYTRGDSDISICNNLGGADAAICRCQKIIRVNCDAITYRIAPNAIGKYVGMFTDKELCINIKECPAECKYECDKNQGEVARRGWKCLNKEYKCCIKNECSFTINEGGYSKEVYGVCMPRSSNENEDLKCFQSNQCTENKLCCI